MGRNSLSAVWNFFTRVAGVTGSIIHKYFVRRYEHQSKIFTKQRWQFKLQN